MITEIRLSKISLALAATLFLFNPQTLKAENVAVSTTTIFACGQLFDIQANAAGLTALERAAIVQKNLDNALVAAKDRTPHAVRVVMMNRNPVVTLDRFYVVTADGNSAARAQMSQLALAEKWANSLRECLADQLAVNKYLSMLTGKFTKETAEIKTTIKREDIAVAPMGMTLPVQMGFSLHAADARLGDKVEAVLRADVPFGPDYATYLPAGTKAIGELVSAKRFVPNGYGGKDALTPWFYALRTPDNKDIPIDAYLIGDVNLWKNVRTKPSTAISAEGTEGFKEALREANLPEEPVAGELVGAWRGAPIEYSNSLGFIGEPGYRSSNLQYNGLIIPKHSMAVIPAGSQMLLQLAGTTSISVNSQGPGAM